MQEHRSDLKIPPAWKPDEWICHHQVKSRTHSGRHGSSATSKRISTAKLRQQIENLSLGSAHHRHSGRSSRVKRLVDTPSHKSFRSFLSYAIRHTPLPPIHIPKMSKQSLKRWLDARDAYLGDKFPYLQERAKRYRRRRRPRPRHDHLDEDRYRTFEKQTATSPEDLEKTIDYDDVISILSIESEHFIIESIPGKNENEKPCSHELRDAATQSITPPQTSPRQSGCLGRMKSLVKSPVRSLSRLSLRRRTAQQPLEKKTEIIHDHFDDKCVGTEISEENIFRTDLLRQDQAIQVDLVRPQIDLYYEYDPSMVDGEKQDERIRSIRRYIEYNDKTTETDLMLNFVNVEKESREKEEEEEKESNDKATCPSRHDEGAKANEHNSYTSQSNVQTSREQDQQAMSQSTSPEKPSSPSKFSNRIDPLTDLLQTSVKNGHDQQSSRSTIVSSTESNLSVHEQLQRLRTRFNRLSKQRRLLTCLLLFFAIIMCGLLIGIFILSFAFQGRTPIIYREKNTTYIGSIDGADSQHDEQTSIFVDLSTTTLPLTSSTTKSLARYGESCDRDNDCERPFLCHQKGSSNAPGMCRCPFKYDFVKDQCVGDLNAVCTKDGDCQRFMFCSGMDDGTRRCQCQGRFQYDQERKRCRGDYESPCESNLDCHSNLICNKTSTPMFCSCEFHYRYYPSMRKCRGDPGAVCDRTTAECVDNAECRDGACECSNQFIPNEKKVCVDPCPSHAPNPARIRYPGNCRRFIDCQQKSKTECPEMTIFNLHTQLCDYPKNVNDC